MRYTQLRAFQAVAQAGSFTAAARQLHVSQPTLTTQVRLLENRYGVELFLRNRRGVELTDTGRRLLALTSQLTSLEGDAQHLLQGAGGLQSGTLVVGAVSPYAALDILVAYGRKHPGVAIQVRLGNSSNVLRDLVEYRTDVAVLSGAVRHPALHRFRYQRHPLLLLAARAHPLARHASVPIARLSGERMVFREASSATQRAFDVALARARVSPVVVMELDSREAIREAVARGIGLGTVSEAAYVPDSRLRAVRLSDVGVWTETWVACLRVRRSARPVRAFLDAAEALAEPSGSRRS
jgi:aminoethylphosphonate catabolism LysR family transcriptional regulator